jgi:hypothetical protein
MTFNVHGPGARGSLVLGLLCALLAACGHATAPRATPPSDTASCRVMTGDSTGLVLRRYIHPSEMSSRFSFSFPQVAHAADRAAVRSAAAALCAVPELPPGAAVAACGAAVRYAVTFLSGERTLSTAQLAPTCTPITGIGTARMGNETAVWRDLGRTIGLPRATRATFAGKFANDAGQLSICGRIRFAGQTSHAARDPTAATRCRASLTAWHFALIQDG